MPSSPINPTPVILLLKRSPTAKYHPNAFELPGGKVESSDATLYAALSREIEEETGLIMRDVLEPLEDVVEKTVRGGKVVERVLKVSFIVEVERSDREEMNVKLSSGEHSMYVWASKEMVRLLPMMEGVSNIVLDAMENYPGNIQRDFVDDKPI